MFIRKRFLATLLALFILAGSVVTIAALVIPSAQNLLTQAIDSLYEVQDGHLVAEFEFNTPQQRGKAPWRRGAS
jgi:predicted PurR-regulated permease PerM